MAEAENKIEKERTLAIVCLFAFSLLWSSDPLLFRFSSSSRTNEAQIRRRPKEKLLNKISEHKGHTHRPRQAVRHPIHRVNIELEVQQPGELRKGRRGKQARKKRSRTVTKM